MARRARVARDWQSGTISDLTRVEDLSCASFLGFFFNLQNNPLRYTEICLLKEAQSKRLRQV